MSPAPDRLAEARLSDRGYHLVVSRFEPENHIHEIVAGYVSSNAQLPLIVVGDAPYAEAYRAKVRDCAGGDPRVRFLGGIWDPEMLDVLYTHALTYLHGHSVGGTNPSEAPPALSCPARTSKASSISAYPGTEPVGDHWGDSPSPVPSRSVASGPPEFWG